MAYTIAANAVLGAGKSGLTIGYRLVDVDGVEVTAFTTTNVTETGIDGTYTVTGGISIPDGFVGRIIWGESGTDYAEATLQDADHILKRGMVQALGWNQFELLEKKATSTLPRLWPSRNFWTMNRLVR